MRAILRSTDGDFSELVVVHTSDLHLGSDANGGDGLGTLAAVLAAAREAQLLLVAGDLFDNNRLSTSFVDAAAALLAEARPRVVILPGNHDALTPDSVYRRGAFGGAPSVCVLGLSGPEPTLCDSVVFADWSLEVFGRPHHSYSDMPPIAVAPRRTTRWQIAVAHGQYAGADESGPGDHRWRPSWRFGREELAAVAADYVALGHWERAASVGGRASRAHYSGSPALAGTVNLIRLGCDGAVKVTRRRIAGASKAQR
jgi:hypothetical protein